MRHRREVILEDEASGLAAYLVVGESDWDLSFGGTRIDAAVSREMVVDLADCMSMKLAGHGARVGGAKAGVRAAPDDPRLKPFLGQFAEACQDLLSSTTILGKDMGAKQWMLDEIYASLGQPQLAVAQKRSSPGRCPDRMADLDGYIQNMTGQGVFWAIDQALRGEVRGASVLIQGFGVVGAGVAWHLRQAGAKVVGVSDRCKAVMAPDGFDVNALLEARGDDGILDERRFQPAWRIDARDALLSQPADVLVLAAGSYLIDAERAEAISAPVLVEAANLALTPAARQVMQARKAWVVPDIVANSSSAAMVAHQIAAGNTIPPPQLWAGIEACIRRNTDAARKASMALDLDSRAAFQEVVLTEGRA
jgi:glutamate dehydrogenase (NAD(P)+)